MTWHATISRPDNRTILHLMDVPTLGEDRPRLTSPDEFRAFLAGHPEVEAINVYDSRFPRRPVPVGGFGDKLIAKLFR